MASGQRKSGISAVGDLPWGSHFCHFYQTRHDLLDTVIPFLKTGLENNEMCLWVTGQRVGRKTRDLLREAIPGIDRHVTGGDVRILPYTQWYLDKDGIFHPQRVIASWNLALAQALDKGYDGLRAVADERWLGTKYWQAFADYEHELNEPISRQPMIVMCAYPLEECQACAIFDVARTHQFAIAARNGSWQTLETPELKQAKAELKKLNEELEARVLARTRELAVTNQALRQSQLLLQAIIDNTTAVIYVKDLQGRYLLVNRRFEELTHFTPPAAIGKTDFDLFPREQAEAFRAFDRRVLEAGTPLETEEIANLDDGPHTYIAIKCPVFDSTGRPYAICGISTDITDRKQIDRMKDDFISTAAHELRTPLTTVMGYLELLLKHQDALPPERSREFLELVYSNSEVLARIISDLLDLSRVQGGRLISLKKSREDLAALASRAVAAWQGLSERHRFRVEFAEASASLCLDPGKIGQVLENLISNAVKFSPDGGCIRVSGRRNDGELEVTVEDEGIGMQPEQVARIFDKFYRADASHTAVGGLGLGMSITKNIVEAHRGRIWVESAPKHGTRVHFTLPADDEDCALPVY